MSHDATDAGKHDGAQQAGKGPRGGGLLIQCHFWWCGSMMHADKSNETLLAQEACSDVHMCWRQHWAQQQG